jgi:hypothetical protein
LSNFNAITKGRIAFAYAKIDFAQLFYRLWLNKQQVNFFYEKALGKVLTVFKTGISIAPRCRTQFLSSSAG